MPNAADLDTPRWYINGEKDEIPNEAGGCQCFNGEEVHRYRPDQWAFRKVFHGIPFLRSGAGSIPFFAKTRRIVERPT